MTLAIVSWIVIILGVLTALAIALDIRQRPQHMTVMNITWPITGLYFPVIGWWMYIAMVIGFVTAYPANWWLINKGIKHGM
ncbi:MAG: DUF4396 domain-containing protein [Salinisphaera sp.]|jgi:hypothetical protein|nr:DUF4396 domain-containing protein [Salinisphaera sp.]